MEYIAAESLKQILLHFFPNILVVSNLIAKLGQMPCICNCIIFVHSGFNFKERI